MTQREVRGRSHKGPYGHDFVTWRRARKIAMKCVKVFGPTSAVED